MQNDRNFVVAVCVIIAATLLLTAAFVMTAQRTSTSVTPMRLPDVPEATPVRVDLTIAVGGTADAVIECNWVGPQGEGHLTYSTDDQEDADQFQESAERRGWECAGRSVEPSSQP